MRRTIANEPRTRITRISHLLGLVWFILCIGGTLLGYMLTGTYGNIGATNWRTLMTARVVISPLLPILLALAFVPLALVPGEAKGLRVQRAFWILGLTVIPVFLGRNAIRDLLDGPSREVRTVVLRNTETHTMRGTRVVNHFITLDNGERYYVDDRLYGKVKQGDRRQAVFLVHTGHLLDLEPIVDR